MMRKPDYARTHFASQQAKNLRCALAQRMGEEFPRLGGGRILDLCAELVLEVVDAHLKPRDHVRHGQVLWLAVDINDPPRRYRPIAKTRLVPVVLDLSAPEDIEGRLKRTPSDERMLRKAVRLCRQCHEQGGLLSNCDLAELLSTHDTKVAALLANFEQETGTLVPRRANLHDVGSGVSHKRIICLKRYRDGKDSLSIARETCHSVEDVDRYLAQFERIRACREQGFTIEQTAYFLGCGKRLVREYDAIRNQLEDPQ